MKKISTPVPVAVTSVQGTYKRSLQAVRLPVGVGHVDEHEKLLRHGRLETVESNLIFLESRSPVAPCRANSRHIVHLDGGRQPFLNLAESRLDRRGHEIVVSRRRRIDKRRIA